MPKEPPLSFHALRYTLIAISDHDRAYLRKWVMRWIADDGKLLARRSAFLYGGGANFKTADELGTRGQGDPESKPRHPTHRLRPDR